MIWFLLLNSLIWTPELEQAIQVQLQYTKNPAQRAVLESLQSNHSLDGLDQIPLGKLRMTGYYTPVEHSPELAKKRAKMQGSAFLKLSKGVLKLWSYLGKRHGKDAYKSSSHPPKGASGTLLVPGYSVAVNPSKIPYGSVLLVHLDGQPRLLFAQDTGSKVRRHHEIDLYTGIGNEARQEAKHLHHKHEFSLLSLAFSE